MSTPRMLQAVALAVAAHGEQKRKYTGEPYVLHVLAVAQRVDAAIGDEDATIAAVLHDTLEDTALPADAIEHAFGPRVLRLVREVTDVSTPADGNRAARKAKDLAHLAQASAAGQSIKVADLIDNTASIAQHDHKFARVYLREKRALLAVLTRAEPGLLRAAEEVLHEAERRLNINAL